VVLRTESKDNLYPRSCPPSRPQAGFLLRKFPANQNLPPGAVSEFHATSVIKHLGFQKLHKLSDQWWNLCHIFCLEIHIYTPQKLARKPQKLRELTNICTILKPKAKKPVETWKLFGHFSGEPFQYARRSPHHRQYQGVYHTAIRPS
jgi:hypothetical protein